jgi:hypothetical protein
VLSALREELLKTTRAQGDMTSTINAFVEIKIHPDTVSYLRSVDTDRGADFFFDGNPDVVLISLI